MIYTLLTGGFHLKRKLYYLFDWEYDDIKPDPILLRQRHLLIRQIEYTRKRKIKLRPVKTNDMLIKQVIQPIIDQINKTPHCHVSFDSSDYSDSSSEEVDISEYN
jgi:hypothetical protein